MAVNAGEILQNWVLQARQAFQQLVTGERRMVAVTRAGDRMATRSRSWFQSFGRVALGFTVAYRAMNILENSITRMIQAMREGLQEIDDFNKRAIALAGILQSIAKSPTEGTFAFFVGQIKAAQLQLELLAAQSLVTGRELTLGFEEFLKRGVIAQTTEDFKNLSRIIEAITLLTIGQTSAELQIRQEIRALFGQSTLRGAVLLQTLRAINPELEEQLDNWRTIGRTTEGNSAVLKGIADQVGGLRFAIGDVLQLSSTWKNTLETINTRILREGLLPLYTAQREENERIVGTLLQQGELTKRAQFRIDALRSISARIGAEWKGILFFGQLFLDALLEIGREVNFILSSVQSIFVGLNVATSELIADQFPKLKKFGIDLLKFMQGDLTFSWTGLWDFLFSDTIETSEEFLHDFAQAYTDSLNMLTGVTKDQAQELADIEAQIIKQFAEDVQKQILRTRANFAQMRQDVFRDLSDETSKEILDARRVADERIKIANQEAENKLLILRQDARNRDLTEEEVAKRREAIEEARQFAIRDIELAFAKEKQRIDKELFDERQRRRQRDFDDQVRVLAAVSRANRRRLEREREDEERSRAETDEIVSRELNRVDARNRAMIRSFLQVTGAQREAFQDLQRPADELEAAIFDVTREYDEQIETIRELVESARLLGDENSALFQETKRRAEEAIRLLERLRDREIESLRDVADETRSFLEQFIEAVTDTQARQDELIRATVRGLRNEMRSFFRDVFEGEIRSAEDAWIRFLQALESALIEFLASAAVQGFFELIATMGRGRAGDDGGAQTSEALLGFAGLQQGAIFPRGFFIGEREPELLAPLSRLPQILEQMGAQRGEPTIIFAIGDAEIRRARLRAPDANIVTFDRLRRMTSRGI